MKNIAKEMGETITKLIKGVETLTGIEEIDVGTPPKELVYEEDQFFDLFIRFDLLKSRRAFDHSAG